MKTRSGFVSNSSSSSFIIDDMSIDELATYMLNIVVNDWSEFDEEEEVHPPYDQWKENLKVGLASKEVQNGEIGIILPSTNFDTYIAQHKNKLYVATANNHQWDLNYPNLEYDNDRFELVDSVVEGYDYFDVRNCLTHSVSHWDRDSSKESCPSCEKYYGQYVMVGKDKICGRCYKGVIGTDQVLEKMPRLFAININEEELKELINGLACSYDQSQEIDAIVAKALTERLKTLK